MFPSSEAVQDYLFEKMRVLWAQNGRVAAVAFFLREAGDHCISPMPQEQQRWEEALALGMSVTGAVATIVHVEAWAVMGQDALAALAAKHAGLESLEQFPGRQEIVLSTLRTPHGTRSLSAVVQPDRTLGPTSEMFSMSVTATPTAVGVAEA